MLLVTIEKFETNLVLVKCEEAKTVQIHEIWSLETRTTDASVLGTKCMWTSSKGFWYKGGRWRLCNT